MGAGETDTVCAVVRPGSNKTTIKVVMIDIMIFFIVFPAFNYLVVKIL